MKDDYPLKGDQVELKCNVEKNVKEILEKMSGHSKLSVSEIVNTAVKRFITVHSDFLPPKTPKK